MRLPAGSSALPLTPAPLQMLENQVEVRQREVVELQSQVKALSQEVKDADEVDGRRQLLETKFQELLEPLQRRRNLLLASREVHQFNRDVEDEIVSSDGGGGWRRDVAHQLTAVCCPAVGPGEDGGRHLHRARLQPADGPAAHQEEPGGWGGGQVTPVS